MASDTVKLGDYLFTRLLQLGVTDIFGVPGDYNLRLLDYVVPAGLHWVGNCNELNAAYAADGYGRIKGLSALVTTFGVGELSAANGIAGAYGERSPVVHIVGTPPRPLQSTRALMHHTFSDGEYGRFSAMAIHITAAQTKVTDTTTAPDKIDLFNACKCQLLVVCKSHKGDIQELSATWMLVSIPHQGISCYIPE